MFFLNIKFINSLPIEVKEFMHNIEDKNSELEVKGYGNSSKKNLVKLTQKYDFLIIIL